MVDTYGGMLLAYLRDMNERGDYQARQLLEIIEGELEGGGEFVIDAEDK